MKLEDIIRKPLITEKGARQRENANAYFFMVDFKANKNVIREAVEKLFKVKVARVQTMTVSGKKKRVGRYMGRVSDWKKAIVTLKKGETIKVFEGA